MCLKMLESPEKFSFSNQTIGEFLFANSAKYANEICFIDGPSGKKETFSQVKMQTVRLAINLQKLGVTTNDVIVTCAQNFIDFLKPTIAGAYLGCIVSNFYPNYAVNQLEYLLKLIEPSVIFVDKTTVEIIEKSAQKLNLSMQIIVLDGACKKYKNAFDLMQPCGEEEDAFVPIQVDFDKTAIILFSSGTTGNPKGICHSHRRIVSSISKENNFNVTDSILHYKPFYGLSSWLVFFKSFHSGMVQVFYVNLVEDELLEAIDKYSITTLMMTPICTYRITNSRNLSKYNLTSVKCIIMGGSSITTQQLENLTNVAPKAAIIVSYGATEVGVVSCLVIPLVTDKSKWKSVAKIGKGVTLKVVDIKTGKILGPNQKGEICVKTNFMMIEYYKQKDNGNIFDKDGFYKTGDIGYYDENEFIYIIDRIKESFKYRCCQIAPNLIESLIMDHPAVEDAAVIGIPNGDNKEMGELPAACVVLKPNQKISKEELKKFVEDKVSDYEKLRGGVYFMKSIPRTPTGKIIRRDLKKSLNFA